MSLLMYMIGQNVWIKYGHLHVQNHACVCGMMMRRRRRGEDDDGNDFLASFSTKSIITSSGTQEINFMVKF